MGSLVHLAMGSWHFYKSGNVVCMIKYSLWHKNAMSKGEYISDEQDDQ